MKTIQVVDIAKLRPAAERTMEMMDRLYSSFDSYRGCRHLMEMALLNMRDELLDEMFALEVEDNLVAMTIEEVEKKLTKDKK